MSISQNPVKTGLLEFIKTSVGCQFVIPVYQRNYTWTAGREVEKYLQDLKSILKNHSSKHFLGIMIYLENTLSHAEREFSIIDGQQRLTTTFLFLYAIKDYLLKSKASDEEINMIEGQYLINPFASSKIKFKLKPLVSDDEVYQHIVNGELEKIEDKNSSVYKNFIYIGNFIEDLVSNGYSVNQILLAIDKLYVVCIPLASEDNVQKIFESINATGVKLTAADLIRNFILMDLQSDEQEKFYQQYWQEIEKLVSHDPKKLQGFFRFFLAAKNYSFTTIASTYTDFMKWFKEQNKTSSHEEILKEIVDYADSFNIIYRKDLFKIELPLRNEISHFRKLLSEMPAPLLLEMFSVYKKGFLSCQKLSEVIGILNIYLIRRAICNLDSSSITRLFPAILRDTINDCKGNYENIVEIFKKNLINKNKGNAMYLPDDKQLHDMIVNANMYNIRSILKLVFDGIEHHNNKAPVDLSVLNIEHIIPQTPTKEWYDALGVDQDEYLRHVNRLGNLTLTTKSDNSAMKNNVWEYKNKILKNTSHIKMNEDLLKVDQWKISNVEQRTIELINKINQVFPYVQASNYLIKKIEIYLYSPSISATGFFYVDDGSVEINEGSQLYIGGNDENYPEFEDMRQELLDDGIIAENDDGLFFIKQHTFYAKQANSTALSTSAAVILLGNRNGWVYWMDASNNKELNQNKELKNKFS